MQGYLNVDCSLVAYLDDPPTNNPLQRPVTMITSLQAIPVSNPSTRSFQVAPFQTLAIFDGTVPTSIDGTSAFTITLSPLNTNTYRFTEVSGTSPALRPDRVLALSGDTATIHDLGNSSAQLSVTGSATLAALQLGDTVLIPGVSTGDAAGPFNILNEGYWQVIGLVNSTNVTLARPTGIAYSVMSQSGVALTTNRQIMGFGAVGVQIGNSVDLNMGTFPQVLGTYTISAIAPTYFEITSTNPLPLLASVLPGLTGMLFFAAAKAYCELFADQSCHLQANGSTDTSERLDPWTAGTGNPNDFGYWKKVGLVWKLGVVNRTAQPLNLIFVSCDE